MGPDYAAEALAAEARADRITVAEATTADPEEAAIKDREEISIGPLSVTESESGLPSLR